jgi:hypothetical protein
VLTGTYLTAVMVTALLAANRVPFLEDVALLRNAASYAAFVLVMLIPLWAQRRSAVLLFASGALGWFLFTMAYWLMGVWFENLHTRFRRPLHMFILGVSVYGVCAVALWVATMVREALRQPVAASRRRPY